VVDLVVAHQDQRVVRARKARHAVGTPWHLEAVAHRVCGALEHRVLKARRQIQDVSRIGHERPSVRLRLASEQKSERRRHDGGTCCRLQDHASLERHHPTVPNATRLVKARHFCD